MSEQQQKVQGVFNQELIYRWSLENERGFTKRIGLIFKY